MLHFLKRAVSGLKKITLVVVVFSLVISLFSYFINKDKVFTVESATKKNRDRIYAYINDPQLNSTASGKNQIRLYREFMCKFVGEACTDNPNDGDKYLMQSFAGKMSSFLALPLTNPPASGAYWVANGLQNAGFVPKTYASEGIGFASIKPLIGLWTIFRDISYMVLVIVLLVIGFMIMFRMKLNPQTVISVENALPKIIIAMILITFSFAIAGFLIDAMYVVIAVGISLLSKNNTYFDTKTFQNEYMFSGMGKIYTSLFPKKAPFLESGVFFLTFMGNSFLGLLDPMLQVLIRIISGAFGWIWIGPNIINSGLASLGLALSGVQILGHSLGRLPETIFDLSSTNFGKIFGALLGAALLPQLLLGVAIFFTMVYLWFRIFFMLFRAYLQIILYIVFAPLFILLEAVPSSKSGFATWFKSLFAEIITFPIVILLLVVGYVLVNNLPNDGHLFAPPFMASSINQGIDAQAYGVMLSMGIIFLIPDLVAQAKQALGVKGSPFSIGLGTFFGGVSAGVGGGLGLVGQYSSIAMAFPGLKMALASKGGFLQKALGVNNNDINSWKDLQKAQPQKGGH